MSVGALVSREVPYYFKFVPLSTLAKTFPRSAIFIFQTTNGNLAQPRSHAMGPSANRPPRLLFATAHTKQ